MPRVYIILSNWNGWRDTIECLESVLRLNYESFRVIVCDNASGDDSLNRIAEWASGSIAAGCANPELQNLTSPPYPKPIPFLRIGPGEQVSLGTRSETLFLVQTGADLGFAGGNNVGLRLALSAGDLDYAWLLNNDTVVEPGALSNLVAIMQERPDVGICGSTLLYYYSPQTVQALGGSDYNRWTARSVLVGSGLRLVETPVAEQVERQMKYIIGASMLVKRTFLETIGLMSESYYLYYEEIDWATRASGLYMLAYSRDSIVYHKVGSTIGTARLRKMRSATSEFYSTRSRILFTRKHFAYALPTVCCAVLLSAVHRLLLGNWANLGALIKGVIAGFAARSSSPLRGAVE